MTTDIAILEQRLRHINAAKHGDGRLYDMPFGPALLMSVGLAVLVGLWSPVMLWLRRVSARVRRASSAARRRRVVSQIDERLACRWPGVWSARILFTLPAIVLVIIATLEYAVHIQDVRRRTIALIVWGVTVALGAAMGLRTQRVVRSAGAFSSQDRVAYLLHFALLAAVVAVIVPLIEPNDTDGFVFLLTSLAAIIVLSALQVTRCLPNLHTIIGVWANVAILFGALWLSDQVSHRSMTGDQAASIAIVFLCLIIAVATMVVGRRDRWPNVRAVVVATSALSGPLVGVAIVLMFIKGPGIGPARWMSVGALVGGGITLALTRASRVRAGAFLR